MKTTKKGLNQLIKLKMNGWHFRCECILWKTLRIHLKWISVRQWHESSIRLIRLRNERFKFSKMSARHSTSNVWPILSVRNDQMVEIHRIQTKNRYKQKRFECAHVRGQLNSISISFQLHLEHWWLSVCTFTINFI